MRGVVIKKALVRKIRKDSTPFKESSVRFNTGIQQMDIEDYISSSGEEIYVHGNVEIYIYKIYPNTLYVRRKSNYPASYIPYHFSMQWEWLIFKLDKGVYMVGAIP